MGCAGSSKQPDPKSGSANDSGSEAKGGTAPSNPSGGKGGDKVDVSKLNPTESEIYQHPQVEKHGDHFCLNQIFAFVRHGDRLDHTKEWKSSDDYQHWINDTPLTQAGHQHATKAGKELLELSKRRGAPFSLIIASPYFRCAQTASRIAEVLDVPIHFDIDLGEVFDNVSMKGDHLDGKPQFKPPKVMKERLAPDFPNVKYIEDENGVPKFEGKLQRYPEDFEAARMRYAYKTKKLLQKAAAELMSICIVSHGDGVASVVGMLKEDWQILEVPYTAYVFGARKVKVLKEGTDQILSEEPVYLHPEEWDIKLDGSFAKKVKKITNQSERKEMHNMHEQELRTMNAQGKKIQTVYVLNDDQLKSFHHTLDHLGAHDEDRQHLLNKAASSYHISGPGDGKEGVGRVACGSNALH